MLIAPSAPSRSNSKLKIVGAVAVCSLCLVGLFTGCSRAQPDAGHVDVLVRKPLIFGHGGVDQDPVSTGSQFIALTTQAVDVNMQPQQYSLEADDLMTSDGVPLSFNAVIRLQVTDAVRLITQFGPDWYKNNVDREFLVLMRNAVKMHSMNDAAISSTAMPAIDAYVTQQMQAYINSIRLPVRLVDVQAGKANPPDAIKNQRIETAQQEQRIITEQQMKLAEDARKSAEESRAAADNAYRNALNLSPEQFIELQRIGMERDTCERNHCTFVVGNATPLVTAK